MPQKSDTILVEGADPSTLSALIYATYSSLGWQLNCVTENTFVGVTPHTWNNHEAEIKIEADSSLFTITSKLLHGEAFDIFGKNRKNIEEFVSTFNTIRSVSADTNILEWKEKVASLKEETTKVASAGAETNQNIEKIAKASKGGLQVTYAIMTINVLLFIAMLVTGVNFFEPSGIEILKWGANFGPLTLSGEWWRLISATFIHVGFIHLAFNMFALYMIGLYLEPMLGKIKYVAAYLCTGTFASLASLWWHTEPPLVSAGASGAIFGMFGVFLALLSTNLIPAQIRNRLLRTILIFVGYNLLNGLRGNIDNAAHIGGLVSGVAIGYGYYHLMRQGVSLFVRQAIALLMAVGGLAAIFFFYSELASEALKRNALQQFQAIFESAKTKQPDEPQLSIAVGPPRILSTFVDEKLKVSSVSSYGSDLGKFEALVDQFVPLEKNAIEIYDEPGGGTLNERVERLKNVSLNNWQKGEDLFNSAKDYSLSDAGHSLREHLIKYCKLQEQKTELLIKFYSDPYGDYNGQINETQNDLDRSVSRVIEQFQ